MSKQSTTTTIADGFDAVCDGRGMDETQLRAMMLADAAPKMAEFIAVIAEMRIMPDPIDAVRSLETLIPMARKIHGEISGWGSPDFDPGRIAADNRKIAAHVDGLLKKRGQ